MTEQEFRAVYPLIKRWMKQTLADHASAARPVASLGFKRLVDYFDPALLASSRVVVVVARLPVPPPSAMGLARFADFQRMDMAGITYLDTFFVRADHVRDEALHFHELVHVIQWRLLGPERFLALYADGLERFGYQNSPLEVMAYDFQARFEREPHPFSVEDACRPLIQAMTSQGTSRAFPARP